MVGAIKKGSRERMGAAEARGLIARCYKMRISVLDLIPRDASRDLAPAIVRSMRHIEKYCSCENSWTYHLRSYVLPHIGTETWTSSLPSKTRCCDCSYGNIIIAV